MLPKVTTTADASTTQVDATTNQVENKLHSLVCSGALSLAAAQHAEATDWVGAYERYVGPLP